MAEFFEPEKWIKQQIRIMELEEAFNAARLTHPMTGMKYDSFEDYVKNGRNKTAAECVDDFNKPKKDWEIVFSFDLDGNGGTPPFIPKDEPCGCEEEGCKIHSVRRLSDGEIFAVGDLIGWGVPAGYQTVITSFSIENGRLKIDFQPEGLNLLSVDFEKAVRLHKKAKQPLFTTEDGVEIYEGDKTFWVLNAVESDWQVKIFIAQPDCIGENWYCFSTEAAAKEYVKLNKPCLSINDISELESQWKSSHCFRSFFDYLKESK